MKKACLIFMLLIIVCGKEIVAVQEDTLSNWAKNDVGWMLKQGIIPSELQSHYKQQITREEFASLLVSVLNYMTEGKVNLIYTIPVQKFEDTEHEDVYTAYAFGILNGVTEHTFKPHSFISRQEAAVMMANLLKTIGTAKLPADEFFYPDKLSISPWAREAVNMTSHSGLFQGNENGFRPHDHYTREQAISVLRRLLNYQSSASVLALRGQVVIPLDHLGTSEEAAMNVARPLVAQVGTNGVAFTWSEKIQTTEAVFQYIQARNIDKHEHALDLTESMYEQLTLHGSLQHDSYLLQAGVTNIPGEGYLLRISW